MRKMRIAEIIVSDEAGFACSKNKLVDEGLLHLRPFNIAEAGALDLARQYRVPPAEAPRGKAEVLAGDILFNNTNSAELVGKSALVGERMVAGFSNHLSRIRVDSQHVDPGWFSLWLRHLRSTGYFTANATQWVGQAAYRTSDLGRLEIYLPSVREQRRIYDLLSRAEGIGRLRREAQLKAQAVIPALFLDMFGDPVANAKSWAVVPLAEVAKVISGVAKGRKLAPGESVELPYMRVANVKDGYLDLAEVKTIEIKRSEVDKLLIQPGDLLMTEGGDPDKLGRAALWSGEIESCVHQNHIFKVRSDKARLLPTYLRALAGSAYGKAYFLSVAKKTTGIASINKTQLSAFPVVLPPVELQEQFAAQVASVESIAALQAVAMVKAEATFQVLLGRAFSRDGIATAPAAEETAAA